MTAPGPFAHPETHDRIAERAAELFERRRFGPWSEPDQAELDAWLAQSTSHRIAYLRLKGAVARTEKLAAHRLPRPGMEVQVAAPDEKPAKRAPANRRIVFPLLAAASLALIAGLGVFLADYLMEPPVRGFSTDVGGRTLLRFADGTEFELNTDTAIRYRMTNRERIVWLDKGEAWFRVAHNAENPFAVVVGRHRIADLGTEFVVRRGAGEMEVALLKGRAALSTQGAQTAMLSPGDDALATPASVSVIRKTPQELADALAWRRGMLVFRNTRLADAVKEVNRYSTTKLVIADPSIAGVKISANLKTDDFGGFLQFAESVLRLRADRQGGVVLISRASGDDTERAVRLKHNL